MVAVFPLLTRSVRSQVSIFIFGILAKFSQKNLTGSFFKCSTSEPPSFFLIHRGMLDKTLACILSRIEQQAKLYLELLCHNSGPLVTVSYSGRETVELPEPG